MPKTKFQRVIFTCIGVFFMATTMAIFNKYLVMGRFSGELFRQVGISFLEKAPLAFVLQFFLVQPFAGGQAAKYPLENPIFSRILRTGFTVPVLCPIMCLYANCINMIRFHWNFGRMLESVVTRMPINWIFAFCVQVWILGPLNRRVFQLIFPEKQLPGGVKSKCFSLHGPGFRAFFL